MKFVDNIVLAAGALLCFGCATRPEQPRSVYFLWEPADTNDCAFLGVAGVDQTPGPGPRSRAYDLVNHRDANTIVVDLRMTQVRLFRRPAPKGDEYTVPDLKRVVN